jgi:hypothetical protein
MAPGIFAGLDQCFCDAEGSQPRFRDLGEPVVNDL